MANKSSTELNSESILYHKENGVAEITLNRPDVLNSFNRTMAKAFQAALADCAADDSVRAILISGSGRAFCAGQDLAEAAPADKPWPAITDLVRNSYNPAIMAMRTIEKPVICAVNGIAAGAGANLALAGDIVLASDKASFLQAFCHIGLIPDSGGTFFLPRLAGFARATAMSMLGEKIPAQQALEWGMIYKVIEADSLADESRKLAAHLATCPTKGLGLIKRALNAAMTNDLKTQLDLEEELQGQAADSHDYREGVNAFLEKRKPKFTGK